MVSKVATDFAKLEVEDQSPVLRWNWISSVFPMDIICKLDEETEFYDPVMQDNCKLTFTSSGNKLVFISKYSTQTWINSSTITDNFMIIVSFQEHLFYAVLLRNYYQLTIHILRHPWRGGVYQIKTLRSKKCLKSFSNIGNTKNKVNFYFIKRTMIKQRYYNLNHAFR